MANPFEPIEYATIVGRFMVASTDSDDLGDEPDMVAATGKGRFLPSVSHILVAGATPPATIKLAPVDFEFDEQGYISNPITKERGVRVVAPTDAVNPTGFTYRVTFDAGTSFLGFDFSVPAGGTVDLTRVGRVAQNGGVPITRGEPGVGVAAIVLADDEASLQITYDNGLVRVVPVPALDEARVARDEAVEAATNAVAPTQAAIAQALVDPDSEARAALNATYDAKGAVVRAVNEQVVARRLDLSLTQMAAPVARPVQVFHRPSAYTNVISTSTSFTAVDAAALKATVVCPPSGKIKFRLHAHAATGGANTQARWALAVNGMHISHTTTTPLAATSAAPAPTTPATAEGILYSSDFAGTVPLVPGKAYEITWMQASGTNGSSVRTEYGGVVGAAVMEFTPIEASATETPHTASMKAQGEPVPMWMCHDRKTLLGTAPTPWRVRWSTDDGATWTTHPGPSFPQAVQAIRETDDGEIVVFVAAGGNGLGASIWKSTGWAADKATSTFTKVCEQTGPRRDIISGTWREFGIHTHGQVVVAAEYGPKNGPGDMARYVYLSEDYGRTFRTVFDLADYKGVGAHLHGAAYDPWWDALWISNGDDATSKGDTCGNWVSFDRGDTWTRIGTFNHQTTSIAVLPTCILWVTDYGNPNCIWRIPRVDRGTLTPEVAYVLDPDTRLTIYGTQAFQARSMPGAPVLLPMQSTNVVGPGKLVVTYDGYVFKEVWVDSQTYANRGLFSAVGPTSSGKIHGNLNRGSTSGTPLTEAEHFTLTPNL